MIAVLIVGALALAVVAKNSDAIESGQGVGNLLAVIHDR